MHTQRAGRHLPQVEQAVEDARRHARQLVLGQIKGPVGMADMSCRMYMHSDSLCSHLFCVSGVSGREQSYIINLYHYVIQRVSLSLSNRKTDKTCHTATQYITLQYVTRLCNSKVSHESTSWATHCNTMHYTATRNKTLQQEGFT